MEIWNRRNPVGGAPIVDSALDVNSEHCVQNKVVAEQFSAINSNLSSFFNNRLHEEEQQINFSDVTWNQAKNSYYGSATVGVPNGGVIINVGISDFTSGTLDVSGFSVEKKSSNEIFIFSKEYMTSGWVKVNYTYAK